MTIKEIAPCGMNCALCSGFQREKKPCLGCNSDDENKPTYCKTCIIKNCLKLKKFCFNCDQYPCKRLKQLDNRYREKYHMSMLENLDNIKINGIRSFVKSERERWLCKKCRSYFCVHSHGCKSCGEGL